MVRARDWFEQKEEERLRATTRRSAQQKRTKERSMARGVTSEYLEEGEDEDDNSFSIGALKRAYKDKKAGKSKGERAPVEAHLRT